VPLGSVFAIRIGGTELPDDITGLLVDARVDSDLHLPTAFAMRFRDPDRVVVSKAGAKIGTAVSVAALDRQGTATALVTGEITAVEAEYGDAGTFTTLRGYDKAHRMHHGRRTQGWTQATVADVARQIAGRNGLTAGDIRSDGTVHDHLCQAAVSDHAFLSGLAARIGYDLSVADGKLDLTPPPAADAAPEPADGDNPLVLRPGGDLLRIRSVVTGAEQVTAVQARGWDVATKQALVATAPAAATTAALSGTTPAGLAQALGGPQHCATDTPWATQAEVTTAAKATAERIGSTFARLEAVIRGTPTLNSGTAVALVGLGAPFDGKYTTTTARHRYDAHTGYTTAITVTGRQERNLLGLTGTDTRPTLGAGVVIGQVSDVNDPQKQGRVTLKFPWLSEDYVSDWARTVQPGAGKQRGLMHLPEVGDEVLVAFDRGVPGRPYVLGGLHNGVDTPDPGPLPVVDPNSGAINRRSWVSRLGHRIDLLDQDGKTEGITLATKADKLTLKLDAKATTITVHSDGTVTVEGAKGVTVDAGQGELSLKGKQINLTAASGGVKVDGGQGGVSIDGGSGAVNVKAATQLQLQGLTASLEGQTQTTVKGGVECAITAAIVKIN
jgi:phage protein D